MRTKKLFSVALSTALLSCMFTSFAGAEDINSDVSVETAVPAEIQSQMDAQQPALQAYQNLHSALQAMPIGDDWMSVYPDDYAGEYINENNQLVINLVNPSAETKAGYLAMCDNSDSVLFDSVDYSLNELTDLFENIPTYLSDYEIVRSGVDQKANKVLMDVVEEDYYALLQDAYVQANLNCFEIGIGEPAIACASLYGGDGITDDGGSSSICIGGTYNGQYAILTCGHGKTLNGSVSKSGSRIGYVSYLRANTDTMLSSGTSMMGDFAIVSLTGTSTRTNKVRNASSTVSISDVYSSLPQGTTIYRYGNRTGYSSGTINQNSIDLIYNGSNLQSYRTRGLYQCYVQKPIDGGDSGGSVYTKVGSAYKIHGSITAKDQKDEYTMYSSPIYYAIDAGFTPKTN